LSYAYHHALPILLYLHSPAKDVRGSANIIAKLIAAALNIYFIINSPFLYEVLYKK
jgi:hypothetical protein